MAIAATEAGAAGANVIPGLSVTSASSGIPGSALLSGGVSLIGDLLGFGGQQDANAMNMAMNNANITAAWDRQAEAERYNRVQSGLAFTRSNYEVDKAENYNTWLSDTAMQRRVADLNAAGLNPLLAISQGGASTPQMSGMPANAASASPGGQGSSIPMGNPMASFGNLGGQIQNAYAVEQAAANIDYTKAQAANVRAQTDEVIPQNVAYTAELTGLTITQAQQVQANIKQIQASTDLTSIQALLADQNYQVLKGTRDMLIAATNQQNAAVQAGEKNVQSVETGKFGQVIAYINAVLGPIASAVGAAKGTSILPHTTVKD